MITHANVVAFVEWATSYFGTKRGRPDLRPPAAALRPLDVRHLRHASSPAPSCTSCPPSLNLIPQKLARVHPRLRADAVVLGAVDLHVHGEVRRGRAGRLPDRRARALVRRGAADAGARALDGARPARALHEPLRADRGDDREQLLHGARAARRARRSRSRSASPATARSCSCSTTQLRAGRRRARSATSTSAASASAPATGATRRRPRPRSSPTRARPGERIYQTGDLARRTPTGSSTSSGARTRRSRAAATGSSWARSRRR